MASLTRKRQCRFWIACYTDATGVQRQRSTRETVRAKAQTIAELYEAPYRKKMTESQVRRTMTEIFKDASGETLTHPTLDAWLSTWLERTKPEVAKATHDKYSDVVALARKFARTMVAKQVDLVTPADVLAFRGELLKARSVGTTNNALKILRQALKAAWVDGLITENPAARVGRAKRSSDEKEAQSKQPFTETQLRELLSVADDEWRGMILAGIYSAGQRLSDIATMTARQVDLAGGTVRFDTNKTERTVIVPIVDAWREDLAMRAKSREPNAPLFPKAAARVKASRGRVGRVSNTFRTLLSRIGLVCQINKIEGAVDGRRRVTPYSFHSFRHTATSMLKNAGVSDAIARDIVGHESEAVSANYTHIADETKRAALTKLPDLTLSGLEPPNPKTKSSNETTDRNPRGVRRAR